MRTQKLIVIDQGLMILGTENNDRLGPCYAGRALTHDLFDHVNGPTAMGPTTDEMEAMGATYFIRSNWEITNTPSDITVVMEDVVQLSDPLTEIPHVECEEREWFMEAFDKACDQHWTVPYPRPYHERLTVNLLCSGYNKAEAKYKDSLTVFDRVSRVRDAVDELLETELVENSIYDLIEGEDECTIHLSSASH